MLIKNNIISKANQQIKSTKQQTQNDKKSYKQLLLIVKMKFTNAIILALSTQTTLSQAANFRGTYITSDADFDTQRQQLVQTSTDPIVKNIQFINNCPEDVTVDGWQSISKNGGTFSPSGPMVNPSVGLDSEGDRIGYWYTSSKDDTYSFIELNLSKNNRGSYFGPNTKIGHINFSDRNGFSIAAQLKAMNSDGTPACIDSGMKTTYLPPKKVGDSSGSFSFNCPYDLPPNPGTPGSLCYGDDSVPVQVIKENSYAWNGDDKTWTKDFFTSELLKSNAPGGQYQTMNFWCLDGCENPAPYHPQPVGVLTHCYSDTIDTVEITFCPN